VSSTNAAFEIRSMNSSFSESLSSSSSEKLPDSLLAWRNQAVFPKAQSALPHSVAPKKLPLGFWMPPRKLYFALACAMAFLSGDVEPF